MFLTCLRGKQSFGGNSTYRRTVVNLAHQKSFLGLAEMTFGQVHASYSLPL